MNKPKQGRDKGADRATQATPPYRSAAERRAEGKALRDAAPRAAHAGWKPPKGRRDPQRSIFL